MPPDKSDSGKPRWDLLPYRALERVVRVFSKGAAKYAPWGWLTVPNARDRYFAAAQRHLVEWREGDADDAETGESHLAHACCCCLILLARELAGTLGPSSRSPARPSYVAPSIPNLGDYPRDR